MSNTTSRERTKLGYGLSEEEGEAFWLFGALVTIKISGADTAGQYSLMDVEVPPGVGSPWHVHRDEDEWFYVRDGEFELYVGEAHLTLTAGGFAYGPKGVPHTFFGGSDGGKMLVGCGAKFEGLLREIGEARLRARSAAAARESAGHGAAPAHRGKMGVRHPRAPGSTPRTLVSQGGQGPVRVQLDL